MNDPDFDLSQEMRQHLEEMIEHLMATGLTREMATTAAQQRFGNRTSLMERSREIWARPFWDNLVHDLRYAVRMLRKSPAFAAAVVLPLALGIGTNTAIFTVVNAALLQSLPYRAPDRLVHLWEIRQKDGGESEASYPDFEDWAGASQFFDGVAGYQSYGSGITLNLQNQPEQIVGAGVTSAFFSVLGVEAAQGRTFLPDEDRPGASRVVLLSDGLWRRRFAADRSLVGKTITLSNQSFTVIGILPPRFQFALVGPADVWMPLIATPNQRARRYWHWLSVIGRLKPGSTEPQARAELTAIAERISQNDPQHHTGRGLGLVPLRDEMVGQVRPVLLVLTGAIGLVLLLACANVANLILVRSAGRQKELAVRGSLGASRARLMQQLLTESLLLALTGGTLGLGVAWWGVRALIAGIPAAVRSSMPYLQGLTLDGRMLAFTAGVALSTGVAFGLFPALRFTQSSLSQGLQAGRRTSEGGDHQRLRRLLLVAEVAISLVLLAGAGLMMKSTLRLLQVNPGFNPQHLVTLRVSLPGVRYSKVSQVTAFHQSLMDRVAALPGVTGAATVSVLPLTGGGDNGNLRVVDRPDPPGGTPVVNVRTISAGYFRTMGIPIRAGRDLTDRDNGAAPRVVMVNQRLAHQVFPQQDPIGQRIGFEWSPGPWQIVGVAADENTVSLDVENRPVVYFPYLQGPDHVLNLVVRSSNATTGVAESVRGVVGLLDPDLPVYAVRTMDQLIADAPSTFVRRYPALLIGILAGIALLLALIGTYGLVAYTVTQRTQEIGIRVALGATPRDIMRLVMGQGLILVAAGLAIGSILALLLARVLAKLLFGVSPSDAPTFVAVSALLGIAALLACYLPARRALKIAPVQALNS